MSSDRALLVVNFEKVVEDQCPVPIVIYCYAALSYIIIDTDVLYVKYFFYLQKGYFTSSIVKQKEEPSTCSI